LVNWIICNSHSPTWWLLCVKG